MIMSGEAAGAESALTPVVDAATEFSELCRRSSARLVGALTLRCNDRELASDIAQEAMARVWRDWDTVSRRQPIEPWLYATAFNLLRSWHRRLRVARRRAPVLVIVTNPEADADAALSVRDAVAVLPERQREAVVLRYYADLSVKNTAEAMGCAEGTVRALTTQGVAALRAALKTDIEMAEEEVQT